MTDQPALSAAEIAERVRLVRVYHVPDLAEGTCCDCGSPYPCDTLELANALAASEQARERAERLVAELTGPNRMILDTTNAMTSAPPNVAAAAGVPITLNVRSVVRKQPFIHPDDLIPVDDDDPAPVAVAREDES